MLDGANRVRIAAELGLIDIPVHVAADLSPEEKVALALDLNEARRHLSQEDQQRLREQRVELVADLRRQGESLRSIAEHRRRDRRYRDRAASNRGPAVERAKFLQPRRAES